MTRKSVLFAFQTLQLETVETESYVEWKGRVRVVFDDETKRISSIDKNKFIIVDKI